MALQQRHLSHQQEEAGLLFHLLEHIKGCSNPKASPAGIKWSSSTQQQLCHGKQIPPWAGEPCVHWNCTQSLSLELVQGRLSPGEPRDSHWSPRRMP